MKRNRIIIPVVALLSHTMYAQTPVDMNLQLQNVEIQGKRIAGLNGGEVKRLQVDKNLSSMTGTVSEAFRQNAFAGDRYRRGSHLSRVG